MAEDIRALIEAVGTAVDVVGVFVLVAGAVVAFALAARPSPGELSRYRRLRRNLGRAILLGLEILVAADIIRTVAVEPTLENVAVLGLIVVVRTFLSFALEVELNGRWPWQGRPERSTEAATQPGS